MVRAYDRVMAEDAVTGCPTETYTLTVLDGSSAGEILTLQRAAYVSEAVAHRDFGLPPLTQTIDDLRAELSDPAVVALGVREQSRLLGAVRLRRVGHTAELGRLTVVPDRQGRGIGTFMLRQAERVFPGIVEMRLFTGEHSLANIRLYERNGYVETARTPVSDYSLVHFVKTLV